MYLNDYMDKYREEQENWTLTWDVFKLHMKMTNK